MTRFPAERTRSRSRLRGEDGFIIIEVLVSAIILVTVSLAVFLALDNADKAAGNQQRRALAANFAQSELERIRSMPVEDVAAARGTRTVTRDGIEYTEEIIAKWVTDGSDEPECTTRSGGLDYLRTTVRVSWKGMGNAQPVSMTSFYTPPAGAGGGDTGSVSVHITDRNGGPVSNIGVTLDGPQDFTEVTNVNGCVVFGFVPESNAYTVKFARSGFVDGDSNQSVADPVIVTGGETLKLQYDYDRGGYTAATFETKRPSSGTPEPTKPLRLQLFHTAQPSGPKTFDLGPTGASSWNGSSIPLFPFTSPYAIYAGNCKANIPTSGGTFVNITPNVFQNAGTIRVPALDVTVRLGTPAAPGAPVQNAEIQYDPGCTPIYQDRMTDVNGRIIDPGFPFAPNGTGTICAMSQGAGGRRIAKPQSNFNLNGTALTLYLNDTGSKAGGSTTTQTSCFT